MKKVITILLAGLLILGITAEVYTAERKIIVKSSYYVNNQWPDVEKEVDRGNWGAFIGPIAAALFEKAYPNVKIQPVQWKMWGPKAGERLRAALAAGTAPSFYACVYSELGGPQGMINEGLMADITDLVNKWDQKDYIARVVWQAGWRGDRCYGIPHRLSSYLFMAYRKDWFKEAGIFNSKGMPAPENDWNWSDFQEIAKKLTNPKVKHWGTALAAVPADGFRYISHSFGAPMMMPDKSGKYTWRAAFNLPVTVRILEMYKNMVWKDKTAITGGSWGFSDSRNAFRASQVGMSIYNLNDAWGWVGLHRIEPTEKAFEELVGLAPLPRGPEGVRVPIVVPFIFGINPTQTPEEIEATFNWMTYLFAGPYTTLGNVIHGLYNPRFAERGVGNNRIPYRVPMAFVNDPETHKVIRYYIDPYAGTPDDYIEITKLVESEPVEPVVNEYNMWEPNVIAFNTALQAAISKVLTDPNADPKTELDKAADVANKTALNVKLKGVTKENMKNYYTALGDFYKKNFPKYYQEVYKELFEKYYKVW